MRFKSYNEFIFESVNPRKMVEGLAYTFKGNNAVGPDEFDIRYIMYTNLQYQFRVLDKEVGQSTLHLTEDVVEEHVFEKQWPHHMWSTYDEISDTFTETFDKDLEEFFKIKKVNKHEVVILDKEKLSKEKNGDTTLFDILDEMKNKFELESKYYERKSGQPWNRGTVLRHSISYFSKPFLCIMQEDHTMGINRISSAFAISLKDAQKIIHTKRGHIEGKKFGI